MFRELQPGEAAPSVITFRELLYGAAKSSLSAAAIQLLQPFTQFLAVLPLPESAGHLYGQLRADPEVKGQRIGNNHLWIAAKAAGLILVTNNEQEFRRIENWPLR